MMRKVLSALFAFGLLSLYSIGGAFADSKTPRSYYLLSFPKTQIQYPVLIYRKMPDDSWEQIAFVSSASQKTFLKTLNQTPVHLKVFSASLNPKNTEVTKWLSGCEFTINPGNDLDAGTCVGKKGLPLVSMNTADKKHGANFTKLVFASHSLPSLKKNLSPKFYHIPNYQKDRTVTVYNNTQYPVIRVSYWKNNRLLKQHKLIRKNQSVVYHFPSSESRPKKTNTAWVVTGYGTKAGCRPANKSCWVNTSGYGESRILKNLYGTKIKATLQSVPKKTRKLKVLKPTSIKLSAVDGFNFKTIIYPTTKTYCTKNPPSQWAAPKKNLVPYVSLNEPKNPLAELPRQKDGVYPSLINICKQISERPLLADGQHYQAHLLIYDSKKQPVACMSPCRYAQSQKSQENFLSTFGDNAVNQFCGEGLIKNTSYVRMLDGVNPDGKTVNPNNALFKNTYSYQFDDANANMQCPGETSYAVRIFTKTAPPMRYLLPPSAVRIINLSNASATVQWAQASGDKAEDQSAINYKLSILQKGQSKRQWRVFCKVQAQVMPTCKASNLKTNTTHQVKVTAEIGGLTASSKVYNFKTLAEVGAGMVSGMPAPTCTLIGTLAPTAKVQNGIVIVSWRTLTRSGCTSGSIEYSVTAYAATGNHIYFSKTTTGSSIALTPSNRRPGRGTPLVLGAKYNIATVAEVGSYYPPTPCNCIQQGPANIFITPSAMTTPPAGVVLVGEAAATTKISWTAAKDTPATLNSQITYTAVATPSRGTPVAGVVPNSSKDTTATFTGLKPNTAYAVKVTADDNAGSQKSAPDFSFTTIPSVVTAKAVSVTPDSQNPSKATVTWGKATDSYLSLTTGITYSVSSTAGTVSPRSGISQTNRTATITGLTSGESYTVTVKATDTKGSHASKTASPTSPASVVTAKTVTVTPDAQNPSKATVTWGKATDSYPALTAGITYAVTSTKGSVTSVSQTNRRATVTGLTSGESYTVTVKATDTKGSHASKTATKTSPASVVTAKAVTVTPDAQNASKATVTWGKATDSYSALTAGITYAVSISGAPGATVTPSQDISQTNRAATVKGLTPNDKNYNVTVKATDTAGSSASKTSASMTAPRGTVTVSQPTVSGITANSAKVSWVAATDNYPNPSGFSYKIKFISVCSGPLPDTISVGKNVLNYKITGLETNCKYVIKVIAKDQYGVTGASPSASFTTSPF